jgi:hypothetical protein
VVNPGFGYGGTQELSLYIEPPLPLPSDLPPDRWPSYESLEPPRRAAATATLDFGKQQLYREKNAFWLQPVRERERERERDMTGRKECAHLAEKKIRFFF